MSLPETVDEDSPEVDEDGWTVPSAWWRQAEPYRGLGPRRSITIDADPAATVAELWARTGDWVIRTLDRPGSNEELVRRARLYLGTPTGLLRRVRQEFHPLGAAVIGALLAVTAD